MSAFLDWFKGNDDDRSRAEGRPRASLVRHHPPVRRRQRPHRARDRRYGARALRAQPAALLQHVGADPAGAERLLRHPRSDAERRPRHHGLAGLVSRTASTAPSTARNDTLAACCDKARFWEAARRRVVQRPAARRDQSAARRLRGQAHLVEMGEARQSARRTRRSRDIDDLVKRGILAKDAAGGRSTSYSLADI